LRPRLFLIISRRYVDIDPRVDRDIRIYSRDRAFRLSSNISGGKARGGQPVEPRFILVSHHAVVKSQNLLGAEIPENSRMDILCVLNHSGTTAVVVHDYRQEIRVAAQLRVVLFGSEERAERIVMPGVPADSQAWIDGLRGAVNQ